MKKSLLALAAVLALTAAGVAWAGQTTAPTPEPTVHASDRAAVPAYEPALEPDGKTGDEVSLEALFVEPEEAGACCVAQCWEIWGACIDACGGNQACEQQCTQDRIACRAQC